MKRKVAVALAGALCLMAQSTRDDYRAAYRAWREAEPNLEFDAATGGEALAPRASHAASEEAKYGAARGAYLHKVAEAYGSSAQSLQATVPIGPVSLTPTPQLLRFVTAETASVTTNITAFANDTDPGIQPLKVALDRERTALAALNAAIVNRQKIEDQATQKATLIEQDRANAIKQYQSIVTAIGAAAASVDQENEGWAAYYQKLAEGARDAAVLPAAPVSTPPVSIVTPPAAAPAAAPAGPPAASPAAPRTPSIPPLPLARYIGAWIYSPIGGLFHGAAPESVDLVVQQENGRVTGTFAARFRIPADAGDPLVSFSFSGDLRATRIQTFPLETSDGAKGTVDLIPGNAFNLLEVNFEIEAKPGKLHVGDVLLVKK